MERFSFDQLQGDENDLHDWIVERFYLKNKMISERRVIPLDINFSRVF